MFTKHVQTARDIEEQVERCQVKLSLAIPPLLQKRMPYSDFTKGNRYSIHLAHIHGILFS